MQFKVKPSKAETIITESGSTMYARGEGYIFAVKPVNGGLLRIRIRQPSEPYNAQHYWLCSVHFEKGLRPNRFYDSSEVIEFTEQYVRPYRYPS
jgi:hypothetical protein